MTGRSDSTRTKPAAGRGWGRQLRRFPVPPGMRGYRRAWLAPDLLAGLTLAAVAIVCQYSVMSWKVMTKPGAARHARPARLAMPVGSASSQPAASPVVVARWYAATKSGSTSQGPTFVPCGNGIRRVRGGSGRRADRGGARDRPEQVEEASPWYGRARL